jgi:NAD(P)-dependent dehydrogenase (short-subunit alcohol dehydrogenase family)
MTAAMSSKHARLVLVTGATDGIGQQTALDLARRGAHVIVHGRRDERLDATRKYLLREVPSAVVHIARADLASLADVRALGDDLVKRFPRIDVVIHNAGVFMKKRVLTVDGFETTFAVNHLAPFVLTHRLLEPLTAAKGRVLNVSSIAHTRGDLDFGNLDAEKFFDGYDAYARSKLANVLFTVELARRVASRGITTNALHPGVVGTKLLREGFGSSGGESLEEGAATSVYLALADDVAHVTGKYFMHKRESPMNRLAHDEALARKFWDLSARLTGTPASW